MNNNVYDGYYKYDREVASSYDQTREQENHWIAEDFFIREYLHNKQIKSLLDIPVGTGRFFQHYGNISNVIGIDISDEMLKKAREKLVLMGNTSIKLEQGDVFNLRFIDDTFDVVIVFRLFHLMPETYLRQAIKELCRVSHNDVVVQTYNPRMTKGKGIIKLLRTFSHKFVFPLFYKLRLKRTVETKPWENITAYFHRNETIDCIFESFDFVVSCSKLLDTYGNSEVKATVYSKKI